MTVCRMVAEYSKHNEEMVHPCYRLYTFVITNGLLTTLYTVRLSIPREEGDLNLPD